MQLMTTLTRTNLYHNCKSEPVMKLANFFAVCFCCPFIFVVHLFLFVSLDRKKIFGNFSKLLNTLFSERVTNLKSFEKSSEMCVYFPVKT